MAHDKDNKKRRSLRTISVLIQAVAIVALFIFVNIADKDATGTIRTFFIVTIISLGCFSLIYFRSGDHILSRILGFIPIVLMSLFILFGINITRGMTPGVPVEHEAFPAACAFSLGNIFASIIAFANPKRKTVYTGGSTYNTSGATGSTDKTTSSISGTISSTGGTTPSKPLFNICPYTNPHQRNGSICIKTMVYYDSSGTRYSEYCRSSNCINCPDYE